MKEIKEIIASLICAQPVPTALSMISFISAGHKLICAICVSFDDTKVRHSESVSGVSHVLLRTLTFFHAIIGYGVFRCLA